MDDNTLENLRLYGVAVFTAGADRYRCPVPGCTKSECSAIRPRCPTHRIAMDLED